MDEVVGLQSVTANDRVRTFGRLDAAYPTVHLQSTAGALPARALRYGYEPGSTLDWPAALSVAVRQCRGLVAH